MRTPLVAAVSDVSIGYGSPQVPRLLESLSEHYAPARGFMLEPDQSERPPLAMNAWSFELKRVHTSVSHYVRSGTIEYLVHCARELNERRPDVVVVSSSLTLPVLFKLRYRPRLVIYYMLESLSYYEGGGAWQRFMLDTNRAASEMIDLIISPEENRARLDVERARMHGPRVAIMVNAVNPRTPDREPVPASERNGRLLVSGTIQRGMTLAEYYLRPEIASIPIDMYGLIEGPDKHDLRAQFLAGEGQVCYRGYVPGRELALLRRHYSYSLITWADTSEHLRYACPNKFFEAIADGVPPIVTPHPQCRSIVDRYDCGIVMRDWSYSAFRDALYEAWDLLGTPRYAQMVQNCRHAAHTELNWDSAFAKVAAGLPSLS
ncbi:MAG: hypothetical protein HUU18_02285 [Phycisphaerales bacterium]|nr:hypothetical protein [Phycisphaerales bacterium]